MRVKSLNFACREIVKQKNNGKSVGLITGNFDVVHIGHTRLFKFAKENVDILAVGVDSDELARSYRKQAEWLFNPLKNRIEVLESIGTIDVLFPINNVQSANSDLDLEEFETNLLMKLKPTHVITNPIADMFYLKRKHRCEYLGIQLLEFWNTNILEQTTSALV